MHPQNIHMLGVACSVTDVHLRDGLLAIRVDRRPLFWRGATLRESSNRCSHCFQSCKIQLPFGRRKPLHGHWSLAAVSGIQRRGAGRLQRNDGGLLSMILHRTVHTW